MGAGRLEAQGHPQPHTSSWSSRPPGVTSNYLNQRGEGDTLEE